jgi:hypothetical protein
VINWRAYIAEKPEKNLFNRDAGTMATVVFTAKTAPRA